MQECQFFTILQDKLRSFNIQDDRRMRFLCTTNYRIDHIIKCFHEENSILSGLNNLLLCGMQGNNGLLAKPFKKIAKSPTFWLLTIKRQIWMNLNRVVLQHNKEYVMFIFYLRLMVLCAIFKSVWHALLYKLERDVYIM